MFEELTFHFVCFSDKHCNNTPKLYGDEHKIFDQIFSSVESQGRYSVPLLLESKSFHRVFVSPGSMASGTVGKECPKDGAPSSSGNTGESRPSRDEHIQRDRLSWDEYVEFSRVIRMELKSISPHVPDLTLLRWPGEKVRDPVLDPLLNALSSGSDSTSESWSDSGLPHELKSDGTASCLF